MATRTSTIGTVIGGLIVVVLLATGCSSSTKTATAPSTSAPVTTTTGIANAVPVSAGEAQVIVGSATGNSPCEKAAPTAASPGEVGAGTGGGQNADVLAGEHGARGMVVQQPLTRTQRLELQQQMIAARTAAAAYPTVKDAEAAGYFRSTVYVPCIGAHYTNVRLAIRFDPAHPSELLYDGTTPDAKLVGLSYLVYHHNGPPPGFVGKNDHWHQHNANGGLCMGAGGVIGGEETSNAQCAARGGHKALLIDIWMMHAWVVPGFECSWGVFSGECPELGGRVGGTAYDPPAPS